MFQHPNMHRVDTCPYHLTLTPILKSPIRQLCPLWFWCRVHISHQHLFFFFCNKVWNVEDCSRNLQQQQKQHINVNVNLKMFNVAKIA